MDNPLSAQLVVPYLVERGLLDARAIVDGDVEVADLSRRNANYRVTTALGQDLLVKQGIDSERKATVEREAAFLQNAASLGDDPLRSHLSSILFWDADRCVLVFSLASKTQSLAEHHLRSDRISSRIAAEIGAALQRLHRSFTAERALLPGPPLTDLPPWVLSVHRPDIQVFEQMSGSAIEVIKIVQQTPLLCEALDALRHIWEPTSIIHGDMKWDNVVLVPKSPGKRGDYVQLVDWEMVQLGDPLWDAASFLAQYLDVWIGSIPVAANTPQAGAARIPLERLQPAMRRFWQSYRLRADSDKDDRIVDRVVRYAAARLVQFAIEDDQQNAILSSNGVVRLQVAHNMMQRPMTAARSLLGLEI